MKKLNSIAEILLGITFLFGGINGLLIPLGHEPILPVNPNSEFAIILSNTNYIFVLQKLIELCCGILLLSRKFRFVSLVALTPIVVSIFLYHLFDDTNNLLIGFIIFMLFTVSLLGHKKSIQLVLKQN